MRKKEAREKIDRLILSKLKFIADLYPIGRLFETVYMSDINEVRGIVTTAFYLDLITDEEYTSICDMLLGLEFSREES